MSELELKFQVPAEVVPSLRAELKRRGARATAMAAVYFDTPDFAFAREHISLRLRREGSQWVQTLKADGRSTVDRLEHNVARAHAGNGARPELDVDLHADTEAGTVLHKAIGRGELAHVAECYGTEVTRLACDVRIGNTIVEAAFDQGTITAGPRTEAVCELELELKAGDLGPLFELAKTWSAYAGLTLNTRSKALRGALLARGEAHGPAIKARKIKVRDAVTGAQFLRAVLRSTLDQILANAGEIAVSPRGGVDEEHVHQLRVGLRRLRTALRELGPLDQRVDPQWEEPLSRAFAQLGEARDAVTATRAVRPLLEQTRAPKLEWKAAPPADPVATVHDAQFQSTLLDLLQLALQEPDAADTAAEHARLIAYLDERLSKLHTRVGKAAVDFEHLKFEDQHRARKRLKRLRYLAEFAAALTKDKAPKQYLAHLEPAQDALGRHVDIAVAMHRFHAEAEEDPHALFAARYLEGYLGNTARIAQAALQQVAQAEPFWE